MQNMITLENTIKENYLPAFNNQIGTEASPLLAKIKKVPLKSDKIVSAAPIGLSGGFGFGTEGMNTPKSGAVQYDRFETRAKDMYTDIVISYKAMQLTGDTGAIVNAVDSEIRAAYEAARWNTGRALFGNGTGKLATVSALNSAGNTLTVDSTKFLKEGLTIDIYATGGTSPQTKGTARRIESIDRVNKTITLSGEASTFTAGFITVQNSYNREITGLGSIFDSSVTSIYGLTKADNPYLNPIEIDAVNDIDDGIITKALRRAKNEKGSSIDTLLCGDDAYDAYVAYLRENNIRVEDKTKTITGGFRAIRFAFGNKEVDVINESFVTDDEMWGVDSTQCEFHATNWGFVTKDGSGAFNLMENQSAFRALLASYGDFICKQPGGCLRIKNCI